MSLILDALKKSEAERRRGLPPSLHSGAYAPRRRPSRAPWFAGAGAVLLAAGLTGAFFYVQRQPAVSPALADQGPAAAPATPAALGMPAAVPASADMPSLASAPAMPVAPPPSGPNTGESSLGGVGSGGDSQTVSGGGLPVPVRAGLYTPTVLPPPIVAENPAEAPPPPPPMPAEALALQPAPQPAPAPTPTELGKEPAVAAEPPAAPVAAAEPSLAAIPPLPAASTAPAETLPNMYQLPYATRKDLPKLSLTMHVYSPVREESFIVLNGKRYTLDNAQPGPDLNLLDIVADGAVMEFRGQRFLLPRQTY